MAIQYMKFVKNHALDVSEVLDDNTIAIAMYGGGNSCSTNLSEENIRELRKWISVQIRKIDKRKLKPSNTKSK